MERYERCYRDPASPLTPLTPLAENSAFCFDFNIDNLLKSNVGFPKNYVCNNSLQYPSTPLTSTTILDSENLQNQRSFSRNFKNCRKIVEPRDNFPIKIIENINEDHLPEYENMENINQNLTPKMRNVRCSRTLVEKNSQKYTKGNYLELPSRSIGKKQKSISYLISNTRMVKKYTRDMHNPQNIYKESNLNRVLKKSPKKCSPISHKPLSPRTAMLLTKSGLTKYKSLFQREEIDLMVFGMLTMKELESLGVDALEDRLRILEVAKRSEYML